MSRAHRRKAVICSHLLSQSVAGAEEVKFVSLEEAANMDGVRITLIPGIPGIYAECLKNMLDVKGVSYVRTLHPPMGKGDNQELLYKLTAQKSLPTMLCNDERPRNSWIEQVVLADKLGKGRSLIPSDPQDRIVMFGFMNELLGEDGIVWRKRLGFGKSPFTLKYGWSEDAATAMTAGIVASLKAFKTQLEKQEASGSRYMIGTSLTALDIYLATSSIMLDVPGPEIMPRTKENVGLLGAFASNPPEVQAVLDESAWLLDYRDYIYKTHLVTPAVLGGSPM